MTWRRPTIQRPRAATLDASLLPKGMKHRLDARTGGGNAL
jgi:hypothetical protein